MRAVRRIALGLLAVSLAWATALFVFGGFDAKLFGWKFTTHEPFRLLVVAAVSLLAYVFAGGALRIPPRAASRLERADHRWVATGLAVLTFVAGVAYGTFAIGGSDSYGYVSQVDRWLAGHPNIAQPWVEPMPWPSKRWSFAPLGYQPVETEGQWDISPTFSPGLSLLMAGAKVIGGYCAIYLVVPLFGAVLVLATFGIGRRLGASAAGLFAAWFVATSPVFLFMLMAPMSDVAVAALWAAGFYFLLGTTVRSAVASGLIVAIAILVRPNLFFGAAIMGTWYLVKAWREEGRRRALLLHLLGFSAAALLGIVAVAVINWRLRGSPLHSGYGNMAGYFDPAHVLPNLRNYAAWLGDTQTPFVFAGLAALFIPLSRLWPGVRSRLFLIIGAVFVAAVFIEFDLFLVFDVWWYLRFLLPCWPFIMLGLGSVAVVALRSSRPAVTLAVAVTVAVVGLRGLWIAGDRYAFQLWKGDHKYVAVAMRVRSLTDDNSVVLSSQHSGSLRYYSGRLSMRYDGIDADWLDGAVAWLTERQVRVYALLEDWEVAHMKQLFAGQQTLQALEAPPVFIYTGPAKIYFFDLARPPGSQAPTEYIRETYQGPRCFEPAPPGVPAFAR